MAEQKMLIIEVLDKVPRHLEFICDTNCRWYDRFYIGPDCSYSGDRWKKPESGQKCPNFKDK